ncbi:MAG: elongation factor G, partial [Chloroflexota bacterium]|nr:elongation factor G [Chloroflexota bacterium]
EIRRKISMNLSLLPLEWKESKVNIIDTPGYADFVGDMMAGLRVADGVVLVVCAASGVEVGTRQAWKLAQEKGLPRLIFINKMDRENADFYQAVGQVQARFGNRCVPIELPIGAQASFKGHVDLVTQKALVDSQEGAVPADLEGQVKTFREKLLEAVAETDDGLLTKYLEGGQITEEELRRALKAGIASGKIVPILVGSALQNRGVPSLLDSLVQYLPSPKERPPAAAKEAASQKEVVLEASATGPLAALVFKTAADPYVGRLTYFRVYSGTFHSDSSVWNANKGRAERVGQLFLVRGKTQETVTEVVAGDIGAVAKLAETSTGDALCQREHPLLLTPVQFPAPILSVSVHPKTKADLDKMGSSLARLCEEDPTLRMHREQDTAETILSGMGEAHLEAAAEKMRRKFGVEVEISTPKVPYKETITVGTKAEYKHKKQTGGHGQYGHVFLALEPLSRGSGFEFASKVVGGSVPKNYIPAVEKGVTEAVQEGVVAHYPLVDIRVSLYDGSYHPVDSSEMSFKIAGSQAVKKGVAQANPVLLEPVLNVRVTVPEAYTGDIIGDLNTKRGRVSGMTPEDGTNVIEAQVPLAEMLHYATQLRSLTQGQGTYTTEFSHYEEVPGPVAQRVIAEAKKRAEEKAS